VSARGGSGAPGDAAGSQSGEAGSAPEAYGPERIILFGSRARGEADPWSDYDIIVIKRTDQPFMERLREMVPYLVEFERPAEILVYTPEEFERMQETGLGWIVRDKGVILYEAEF
jgi:predicted nucleotidyltransferase